MKPKVALLRILASKFLSDGQNALAPAAVPHESYDQLWYRDEFVDSQGLAPIQVAFRTAGRPNRGNVLRQLYSHRKNLPPGGVGCLGCTRR